MQEGDAAVDKPNAPELTLFLSGDLASCSALV